MVFNLSHGFVAAVAETKAMFQLLISPSRPLSAFIFPKRTSFMHLPLHCCLAIYLAAYPSKCSRASAVYIPLPLPSSLSISFSCFYLKWALSRVAAVSWTAPNPS